MKAKRIFISDVSRRRLATFLHFAAQLIAPRCAESEVKRAFSGMFFVYDTFDIGIYVNCSMLKST